MGAIMVATTYGCLKNLPTNDRRPRFAKEAGKTILLAGRSWYNNVFGLSLV
jgi:hypothetical protein